VVYAPRGRHSEKPAVFYQIIELMLPTVPRLEMFGRTQRAGWTVWGNEAAPLASVESMQTTVTGA
jgi:N6-adenosine-specific RNA methylase IME4